MQDPVFSDRKALRANELESSRELDAKMKRWEAKYGTYEDLQRQYEAQKLKKRTCPDGGEVCKTEWHMDHRHRGSEACKKRVAAQKGCEYVPKSHERVTCTCGCELFRINLKKHKQGDAHKNRMQRKAGFVCDLCGYLAKGKRQKRDFEKHCLGKKHIRLIARRIPTNSVTQ